MKKVLAIFLTVLLSLSIVCVPAFAVETDKLQSGDKYHSKDGLWDYYRDKKSPNSITLSTYYGTEKTLKLPTYVDDYEVEGIGCLGPNDYVENITVPLEYTVFLSQAFYKLNNLKTVTFSRKYGSRMGDHIQTIKRFDDSLFFKNTSVEKIILPNKIDYGYKFWVYNGTVQRYLTGGALWGNDFYGCTNLKEVVFPDDLVYIGDESFKGCSSIETLIIPEGVVCTGTAAFANTTSLKTLVLPDTLEYTNLRDVTGDTTIYCNSDSPIYSFLERQINNDNYLFDMSSLQSTKNTEVDGDINRDETFNITDVTHYQRYLAKVIPKEIVNDIKLDFNGDGKININDCTAMQKALAKIS